jgi:thiosulfate/3-mercaptopyruvate sulfurtransferase
MKYEVLITTEHLAANLHNPEWTIVDCRFDLMKPDWGYDDYQQGHILGAVYAHLDNDLADRITPHSGRHPLPSPEKFCTTLENLGISNSTQVVVYDTSGGGYAARLWWMLKYFGHDAVALLDGGYAKWAEENRPISKGIDSKPHGIISLSLRPEMVLSTEQIVRLVGDPSICMIDARAAVRYRGEQEPIDPVAGHIPGALNRFHVTNLSPKGVFLPPSELKSQFAALLKGASAAQAVVYCGSGVTSCHHIIAMALAGLELPRLYAGSWSEWIRDPSRPIAKG